MRLRFLSLAAALCVGALLAGCAAAPYGGLYDAGPYYGGAYGSYDPYYGARDPYSYARLAYPRHRHDHDRFRKHHHRWKDADRHRRHRDWDRKRDRDRDWDRDRDRDWDRDDDRARDKERDRDGRNGPPGRERRPDIVPDFLRGNAGARSPAAPPADLEGRERPGGERLVTELLKQRRR